MQLKFSNNTITGNLAGKVLHCVVRMSQGTGSPPRGEYVIPPPTSDAIYGQTALVIPLRHSPKFFHWGAMEAAGGAVPRAGLASSAGGGAAESAGGAGAERQAAAKEVLVLSDKPIAGRNCLVVSVGFADLMLGLQATGGATLTVL